jgi:hypothetical protein
MTQRFELQPAELYRRTDPDQLGFQTTADVSPSPDPSGRPTA